MPWAAVIPGVRILVKKVTSRLMAKFKLFARESSAPKNQAAIIISFARIIG